MALRVDLLLKITKVVITMVIKRLCIPVAQINGLSGMTYIQIDICMHILLNYKTQYDIHYDDKETMRSKYLL